MQEVKREKRRLDDLLTLREDEIARIKKKVQQCDHDVMTKESMVADLEKKYKHLEKKYEKNISKLSSELGKYRQSQPSTLQNTMILNNATLLAPDEIKTQKRQQDMILVSTFFNINTVLG